MADNQKLPLVLVADDEIHTTVMLERIFEREGYRVHCAYDGVSALDDAKTMIPDLILLDIQMPGMSGFDVLHSLRQNASTANIPTILITAKARQPADVAHGLNLGADDYIYKPFDPRELLARAESKVKARRLEDNLQRRTQELAALLRVGDELNQSLEVNDLMELVLSLTLDLLPGNLAAIYRFDEKEAVSAQRFLTMRTKKTYEIDAETVMSRFKAEKQPSLWPGGAVMAEPFPSGMVAPLKHGDTLLGMLMIVAEDKAVYDENHFRLFRGIGRQAALSLRNGELYEILMNQNEHLEDMVVARTADLQSAQQMLIRSEKLASIGHLAASIAHEINNPLQPIRIHLEHMLEDIQSKDPIDEDSVKSIQESIERITRIVSQLLEFAGKRSPNAEVEFLDLIETCTTIPGNLYTCYQEIHGSTEGMLPLLVDVTVETVQSNLLPYAQSVWGHLIDFLKLSGQQLRGEQTPASVQCIDPEGRADALTVEDTYKGGWGWAFGARDYIDNNFEQFREALRGMWTALCPPWPESPAMRNIVDYMSFRYRSLGRPNPMLWYGGVVLLGLLVPWIRRRYLGLILAASVFLFNHALISAVIDNVQPRYTVVTNPFRAMLILTLLYLIACLIVQAVQHLRTQEAR